MTDSVPMLCVNHLTREATFDIDDIPLCEDCILEIVTEAEKSGDPRKIAAAKQMREQFGIHD